MTGIHGKAEIQLSVNFGNAGIIESLHFGIGDIDAVDERFFPYFPTVDAVITDGNAKLDALKTMFGRKALFIRSVVVAENHQVLSFVLDNACIEHKRGIIGNIVFG